MATSDQRLRIALGATRSFDKVDIGKRGLVRGWAAPEDGHTWNDGLEAVLWLEAEQQPVRAVDLIVEGTPYVFGDVLKQEVTLFANGGYVGFWRFTDRRPVVMAAQIEPEQWVLRRGLAHLNLLWFIPDSSRPREIGDGPDGRCLGFAFHSLRVAEARND